MWWSIKEVWWSRGSVPATGPPGQGSNLSPGSNLGRRTLHSVVWEAADHTVILYKIIHKKIYIKKKCQIIFCLAIILFFYFFTFLLNTIFLFSFIFLFLVHFKNIDQNNICGSIVFKAKAEFLFIFISWPLKKAVYEFWINSLKKNWKCPQIILITAKNGQNVVFSLLVYFHSFSKIPPKGHLCIYCFWSWIKAKTQRNFFFFLPKTCFFGGPI